jgi:hypothetical protein
MAQINSNTGIWMPSAKMSKEMAAVAIRANADMIRKKLYGMAWLPLGGIESEELRLEELALRVKFVHGVLAHGISSY